MATRRTITEPGACVFCLGEMCVVHWGLGGEHKSSTLCKECGARGPLAESPEKAVIAYKLRRKERKKNVPKNNNRRSGQRPRSRVRGS